VPMVPDGNCFYRSVSDQLYRDKGGRHVLIRQQTNNHILRNGQEFKDFLLLNDSDLEVLDIAKYIERMGQDGEWAENPEIYAAAWYYKMDITIYSKAYTTLGRSLVFKSAGTSDEGGRDRAMMYVSYHDSNHYNSIKHPTLCQLKSPVTLKGLERLKAEMEHEDEDVQASTMETTESGSRFPEGKLNPIGERSRKDAEVAPDPQIDFTLPNALFPLQGMVAQYGADLRKTISNHRDRVLNILREESSNEENSTVRASRYEELRPTTYPIMSGLSHSSCTWVEMK